MLSELRIENFAIIDSLKLSFNPGLVIFTGETGAGKSIIIDAVETLLGGRAETTMIRSGSEIAQIEATFRIPPQVRSEVHAILEGEELLDDPDYLILSREIRSAGRNTGRINGRIVNLAFMRQLGEYMVDVHGQSEHLSLLRVRQHLDLLDRYADTNELLNQYRQTYRELESIRRDLNDLRKAESDAVRRADVLTYQINEIDSARLHPDEEQDLLAERTRLANAEELSSLIQASLLALDEGTPEAPSSIDLFGQVIDALNDLSKLDPSQAENTSQAQVIFDNMTELARSLRYYLEGIEYNPARLNQVEERLNLIHNLKRKYGEKIPEILEFATDARRQLHTLSHANERIEELQSLEKELLPVLSQKGEALSKHRHEAAQKLKDVLEIELADLRMPEARFEVDFQQSQDPEGLSLSDGRRVAFDANGMDRIEFLIAPNPGEGLKPLVKIASGGETSRLMLAIKNVLARADHVPALIFDEIDQGIGGRVGAIVGYKLWHLARLHQVLCITHLPQLAAFGEQHFQVQKKYQEGRTITIVNELKNEARLNELAHMMGEISDGTLHSAREILQTVEEMRRQKIV